MLACYQIEQILGRINPNHVAFPEFMLHGDSAHRGKMQGLPAFIHYL